MKPTVTLREAGQSLWLDNITRKLLKSGTLGRYIGQDGIAASRARASARALKRAKSSRPAHDD